VLEAVDNAPLRFDRVSRFAQRTRGATFINPEGAASPAFPGLGTRNTLSQRHRARCESNYTMPAITAGFGPGKPAPTLAAPQRRSALSHTQTRRLPFHMGSVDCLSIRLDSTNSREAIFGLLPIESASIPAALRLNCSIDRSPTDVISG
jgi:hypothetical protein